jgi:hypothetical protein
MRSLVLALALGVLAGCGQPGSDRPGAGAPDTATPPATTSARLDEQAGLDEQARQALARWADAVAAHGDAPRFVPVGDGFALVGALEPEIADNAKSALLSGRLEAAPGVLPAGDPGSGEVRWDDGRTLSVPLLSAEASLSALTRRMQGGDCGGCTPLRVVGVRQVTVQTATDRGRATAPAWEYELAGTAVRITQVAVAPAVAVVVTPPPWDPDNPPAGLSVESAVVAADDRTVTVHFTGSPEGTGPCTSDYTARAVESEHAAVVIVEVHPYPVPSGQGCSAVGYSRTATLVLAAPLGQRTLLQVVQGTPIQTTR